MDNLHISTMTATSSINSDIDLDTLFHNLDIQEKILFIQHGTLGIKGMSNKKKKNSRKPKPKRTFFNQVTLHINCEKIVNVKLFNNGKVQMTGLKYEKQGLEVLDVVKDIFMKDYDLEFLDRKSLSTIAFTDFSSFNVIERESRKSEVFKK